MPRTAILQRLACLLTVLMIGCASATARAQEESLPPIDMLVYIDNSKTIFTGTPDAPNKRMVEMLTALFQHKIDNGRRPFVTDGDKVSLYTFGTRVRPLAEGINGGATDTLTKALGRMGENAEGEPITDFEPLLNAIITNPAISNRDNHLKIVLIASDFIHDPNNTSSNKAKTGICDQLKTYADGKGSLVDGKVTALQQAVTLDDKDENRLPVFFGLLAVRPNEAEFAGASKPYRGCALDTVRLRPLPLLLEAKLNAATIEYSDSARDVGRFADSFVTAVLKSALPPLQLAGGECKPRGQSELDCSVIVRNSGRVENQLREVAFYTGEKKEPVSKVAVRPALMVGPRREVNQRFTLAAAAAEPLLRSRAILVNFASDSRRSASPQPIAYGAVEPLIIRSASAGRDASDQPYTAKLEVDNPQSDPKTAFKVSLRDRTHLYPEIALVPPVNLAGGARVPLRIPLPRDADAALSAPGGLEISIHSNEADGTTERQSQSVKIELEAADALRITHIDPFPVADPQQTTPINLTVTNPNRRSTTVQGIRYISNNNVVLGEGRLPTPVTVAPGMPATFEVALPPSVLAVGTVEEFRVAVTDSLTGQLSSPEKVPRLKLAKATLMVRRCIWGLPSRADEPKFVTLECTVVNGGTVQTGLARLDLHRDSEPAEASLSLALTAPVSVAVGGETTTRILLNLTDSRGQIFADRRAMGVNLDQYKWLKDSNIRISATDRDGNTSKTTNIPGLPQGSLTFVDQPTYDADKDGNLAIKLTIRNDTPVPRTLTAVRIGAIGQPYKDTDRLPIGFERKTLDAFGQHELLIPVSPAMRMRNYPHLTTRLFCEEDGKPDSCPPIDLPPKNNIPMRVTPKSPPVWHKGPPLIARLSIQNPAPYTQTLNGLLLSPSSRQSPETYLLEEPVEIGGNAVLAVPLPFNEERQKRLLAGDSFVVCPITFGIKDPNELCAGNNWETVRLAPDRMPLTAVAATDKLLTVGSGARPSLLNLQVSNPGSVPNRVTGAQFFKADGTRLFSVPIEDGVLVLPDQPVSLAVPLKRTELAQLVSEGTPRVVLSDGSAGAAGAGASKPLPALVPVLAQSFGQPTITIQKVPGSEPYTSIRADFDVEVDPSLPLDHVPISISFKPGDGSRESSKIIYLHDGGEADRKFSMWWKYPYDFSGYKNAVIIIEQPRASDVTRQFTIDVVESYQLSHIYTFAGIGFLIGTLGSFFSLFKLHGNFLQNFFSYADDFDRMRRQIVLFLKVFGLGPTALGSAWALTAKYGLSPTIPSGLIWFFVPFIAGVLGLIALILVKHLHIRRSIIGNNGKELPLMMKRWHQGGMFITIALIVISLLVLWYFKPYWQPINPATEKHFADETRPTGARPSAPPARANAINSADISAGGVR